MAKTVVIQFNDGMKWFIDGVENFYADSNSGVYRVETERRHNVFLSMDQVRMIGYTEDVFRYKEEI